MKVRIGGIVIAAALLALPAAASAGEETAVLQVGKTTYEGELFAAVMNSTSACPHETVSSTQVPAATASLEGRGPKGKSGKRKIKFKEGKTIKPAPATDSELPPLQQSFGTLTLPSLKGPTTQHLMDIKTIGCPVTSYEQFSCDISTASVPGSLLGTVIGYHSFDNGALNLTVELSPTINGVANSYTQRLTCGSLTGTPLINADAFNPCRGTLRLKPKDEGDKTVLKVLCADPTANPFTDGGLDKGISNYTARATGEIEIEVKELPGGKKD